MSDNPARADRTVVLATYTVLAPFVMVGVFFRALRLGARMARRGWRVVLLNTGPYPDDPKVDAARGLVEGYQVPFPGSDGFGRSEIADLLAGFDPDLLVLGEGPAQDQGLYLEEAARLGARTAIIDQYYQGWMLEQWPDHGVDALLLYALEPHWRKDPIRTRATWPIPPFVGDVAERDELALPEAAEGRHLVTVLGLDPGVRDEALSLLGRVGFEGFTLLFGPGDDEELARRHGLDRERIEVRPAPSDRILFGALAASRVALVANGYMQIVECLALGTPVIPFERPNALPLELLWPGYGKFVATDTSDRAREARLRRWLRRDPIGRRMGRLLASQRDGVGVAADLLEGLFASPEG